MCTRDSGFSVCLFLCFIILGFLKALLITLCVLLEIYINKRCIFRSLVINFHALNSNTRLGSGSLLPNIFRYYFFKVECFQSSLLPKDVQLVFTIRLAHTRQQSANTLRRLVNSLKPMADKFNCSESRL